MEEESAVKVGEDPPPKEPAVAPSVDDKDSAKEKERENNPITAPDWTVLQVDPAEDKESAFRRPNKVSTKSKRKRSSASWVEGRHDDAGGIPLPSSSDEGSRQATGGSVSGKFPRNEGKKKPAGKAPDGKAPDGKAPDGKAPDGKAPAVTPTPTSTLEALRARAAAAEDGMTSYCLSEASCISREQMGVIFGRMREIGAVVSELLLRNSFLERRVCELKGGIQEPVPMINKAVAVPAISYAGAAASGIKSGGGESAKAQLANKAGCARTQGVAPTTTTAPVEAPADSIAVLTREGEFTTVTRRKEKGNRGAERNREGNAIKPLPPAVLITPGPSLANATSDEVKKLLVSSFNPIKEGVQVCGLRKMGAVGFIVETKTQLDAAKVLRSPALAGLDLAAAPLEKRNPEVILRGVDSSLEANEVVEAVYTLNRDLLNAPTLEYFNANFIPRYKVGPRDGDSVSWVISLSPSLHAALCKEGRVYVGWSRCPVHNHTRVMRCYRCLGFGHTQRNCSQKEDTCGHCAEKGHRAALCEKKKSGASPVCANCKQDGKRSQHDTMSTDCPRARAARDRLISSTKTTDTDNGL